MKILFKFITAIFLTFNCLTKADQVCRNNDYVSIPEYVIQFLINSCTLYRGSKIDWQNVSDKKTIRSNYLEIQNGEWTRYCGPIAEFDHIIRALLKDPYGEKNSVKGNFEVFTNGSDVKIKAIIIEKEVQKDISEDELEHMSNSKKTYVQKDSVSESHISKDYTYNENTKTVIVTLTTITEFTIPLLMFKKLTADAKTNSKQKRAS